MNKLMVCIASVLIPLAIMAAPHGEAKDEVRAAAEAFNTAYATNDIEGYFAHYTEDAMLYFYGARHKVSEYHEEWSAMIKAGGGVEKNEMSDLQIQVMTGGNVAIATYFVDNRSRSAEGDVSAAKAFETDIWQRIDGKWKIVNLHYSELQGDE